MKNKLLTIFMACVLQATITQTSHAAIVINNHDDFKNFIINLNMLDITKPFPEELKDQYYLGGLDAFIQAKQRMLPVQDQLPFYTYLGFLYTNSSPTTIQCDRAYKFIFEIKTGNFRGHLILSNLNDEYVVINPSGLSSLITHHCNEISVELAGGDIWQGSSIAFNPLSFKNQLISRNGYLVQFNGIAITIHGANYVTQKVFLGHSSKINHVIQLDNGFLASTSEDKTVKIWDVYSQEVQQLSIVQYMLLKIMQDVLIHYRLKGINEMMPAMHPDWIKICLSLPKNVQIKFKELLSAHQINLGYGHDDICEKFSGLKISTDHLQ